MPRLRLRAKLLVGVLLVLGPVLGMLLYAFQSLYAQRHEAALDHLTQAAELSAAVVDSSFDDALALAQTLAEDPVVQSLDPTTLNPYLERLARFHPDLDNLLVANARGDEVGIAVQRPEGRINVADRRYFQRAMATGAPVLSEVFIGRVVQRPIVVAAAPIRDPTGRLVGISAVALNLDALARRLGHVDLHPGQVIFVADTERRLAFHTALPNPSWEARDLSSWPEVRAALAGQVVRTASFQSPLLGDLRAAVLVQTPRYGWVVGVSWPTATVFGPLEEAFRAQMLVFGTIALLAVLGTGLLAAYLTAPVRQLATQARALGRGELERRVTIATGDELEELGREFNVMAERLQSTLRALGERTNELEEERFHREVFTSAVAHELGNLVTLLLGTTQLLPRWEQLSSERRQHLLNSTRSQAQRINRLVADLLDVCRVEAGRFTLDRRAADLVAITQRVLAEQQASTPLHRIVLEAPDQMEGIWDADRLAQVLTNLVSNAVKYSPEGGEIRVCIRQQDDYVEWCVWDQGVGLHPEDVPYLFQPYSRLYRESRARGLGLGLYITRVIVESHGGRIWATSPGPGQGSTFCFALPADGRKTTDDRRWTTDA